MTSRGRAALGLGVLTYVAGWAFGSRPLYVVAVGLILTVLLAWLAVRLTARPVALRRSIPAMPLEGRRFTYRKRLRVRRVVLQFELAGRFRDRRTALGYLRARSARCDSGKIPFVARLS